MAPNTKKRWRPGRDQATSVTPSDGAAERPPIPAEPTAEPSADVGQTGSEGFGDWRDHYPDRVGRQPFEHGGSPGEPSRDERFGPRPRVTPPTGTRRAPIQSKPIKMVLRGRMADLYNGFITVDEMDDEELARMQFRDVDGQFRGRPPANIPRQLVNSMRAELFKRAAIVRSASYIETMEALVAIALYSDKDSDKLAAIRTLMERVEGKVPDKIELETGEKGFEVTLSRISRRRSVEAEPEEDVEASNEASV